ncbi:MAG: hypothetical protein JO283_13850 [Bradyrhizobium sp.]|nr:hypothetical protein [Bradyrhizobium sp.]
MPLAGKGMLLTSMDIDPKDEADFNRWYDREHLKERVAIEGFIEARRYVAHSGTPKYLCLYSTETIEVLDSPAYRARLANPTAWSAKTMARFKNMIRAVARVSISKGNGRGAVLGILRLRPQDGSEDALRAMLQKKLVSEDLDGIISTHLIESDPRLSGPTQELAVESRSTGDWFVLIDGVNLSAVSSVLAERFSHVATPMPATQVSSGIYDLMWDLAKGDINPGLNSNG